MALGAPWALHQGGVNLDDDRDVARQTANVGYGLLANYGLVLVRMLAMWIMEQSVRRSITGHCYGARLDGNVWNTLNSFEQGTVHQRSLPIDDAPDRCSRRPVVSPSLEPVSLSQGSVSHHQDTRRNLVSPQSIYQRISGPAA